MSLDSTNRVSIDEEFAFDVLLTELQDSGKTYKNIVTEGRGGLSIAQKLAYALDIKQVSTKHLDIDPEDTLFVDDIACTGDTIKYVGCDTAVLVERLSSKVRPTYRGITYTKDNYIEFSWETQNE